MKTGLAQKTVTKAVRNQATIKNFAKEKDYFPLKKEGNKIKLYTYTSR